MRKYKGNDDKAFVFHAFMAQEANETHDTITGAKTDPGDLVSHMLKVIPKEPCLCVSLSPIVPSSAGGTSDLLLANMENIIGCHSHENLT